MKNFRAILYTESELVAQLRDAYEALDAVGKGEKESMGRASDGRAAQWHQPNRLALTQTIKELQKALHQVNPDVYPACGVVAWINLRFCL